MVFKVRKHVFSYHDLIPSAMCQVGLGKMYLYCTQWSEWTNRLWWLWSLWTPGWILDFCYSCTFSTISALISHWSLDGPGSDWSYLTVHDPLMPWAGQWGHCLMCSYTWLLALLPLETSPTSCFSPTEFLCPYYLNVPQSFFFLFSF